MKLLSPDEIKRLEKRIKTNPAAMKVASKEYMVYRLCVRKIEEIYPILKEYAWEKKEFEI